LLQDALRPERVGATVTLLAAKLGLLGGSLVAVGGALLLLAWNPPLAAVPFDLALLVLHLLPISALAVGVAFLVLAGVLATLLRLRPALRIDSLSLVVGIVGGVGLLGWVLWRGRELLAPLPLLSVALLGIGGAGAAYLLGRLLYQGLLALAIRLTDRAPRGRLHVRRYLLPAVAVVALALVALPAAVAAGKPAVVAPGFLPTVVGERVLLIGIDGVLPGEVDYLLKRGALPTFSRLAGDGVTLRYERDPEEPPAAFWTTVATGLPSPQHGVAAVDSFRPLGMETALAVNGPFRWYWAEMARPIGLARQRPLLSNRRSAFTFWELVGRGGDRVVAVNWWGTYPASRLPGLVVAHGGYQLLAEGAAGAFAPETRGDALAALQRSAASETDAALAVARAALPAAAASALAQRALLPEHFYRRAFLGDALFQPRASALYLPAVDIAADGWAGGEVAFADLLAAELQDTDRMLGNVLAMREQSRGWGTVVVLFDPGRRGGSEGRALLWRHDACGHGEPRSTAIESAVSAPASQPDAGGVPELVRPEELAAALFRAAGLPQSAELPAPPGVCRWPSPPATVPTYGRREAAGATAPGSDEYLQNLRSLGYV